MGFRIGFFFFFKRLQMSVVVKDGGDWHIANETSLVSYTTERDHTHRHTHWNRHRQIQSTSNQCILSKWISWKVEFDSATHKIEMCDKITSLDWIEMMVVGEKKRRRGRVREDIEKTSKFIKAKRFSIKSYTSNEKQS